MYLNKFLCACDRPLHGITRAPKHNFEERKDGDIIISVPVYNVALRRPRQGVEIGSLTEVLGLLSEGIRSKNSVTKQIVFNKRVALLTVGLLSGFTA